VVARGRDRLASVQLYFVGGRTRNYRILHRPPSRTPSRGATVAGRRTKPETVVEEKILLAWRPDVRGSLVSTMPDFFRTEPGESSRACRFARSDRKEEGANRCTGAV
jgi:hypothetical protein